MNMIMKWRLKLKRQDLIKAQEELKLLKLLNEQTDQEQRIKKQIADAKQKAKQEQQTQEAEFIGKEFPNYDSP